MSSYWRASLVPAAAVIPAPKAYIKVVAVKKLVVGARLLWGFWPMADFPNFLFYLCACVLCGILL